ncbi:MAG: hypothetical protein NT098_05075 [Candidatus Parcubacteria bacterium]|nr:hypothetical protein [Candidatus Parcubacteria bacterium]
MNKKTIYIFSVLVVVVLAVAGWFLYQSKTEKTIVSPEMLAVTESVAKAQSGVSNAVGKTNPFGADVNPMQGYKNPFE